MTSPRCELCDRPAAQQRVHDGCRARLDSRLKALPGAWRALALWLAPAPTGDRAGAYKRDEAPLPVRLDVLDLRARGGIERLTDWERDWREWHGWTPPPFRGDIEQTITGTIVFLRNNLIWACEEHPGIRDFDREVEQITSEIRSIVNPTDPQDRPRRLGHCPTETVDGRCGAVVVLRPGQSTATCEWCGQQWGPDRYLELAAAQQAEDAGSGMELEAS